MQYVPLRLLMLLSAMSFLEPKKILINQTLSLLEKEEYVGYLMKVDTIEIKAKMTIKNITLTVVVAKNEGYTPHCRCQDQSCLHHIILPRIFAGVFLTQDLKGRLLELFWFPNFFIFLQADKIP